MEAEDFKYKMCPMIEGNASRGYCVGPGCMWWDTTNSECTHVMQTQKLHQIDCRLRTIARDIEKVFGIEAQ